MQALQRSTYVVTSIPPVAAKLYDPVSAALVLHMLHWLQQSKARLPHIPSEHKNHANLCAAHSTGLLMRCYASFC
jgi:hypothetical protein